MLLLFFSPESLAVEETLSQLCSELQVIREPAPEAGTAVVIQAQCGHLLDAETTGERQDL